MTVAVATVLRVFLADAARPRYGYDLMEETRFPSGKLYPILARLTRAGWLRRYQEENVDPSAAGRPPRVMYVLTEAGAYSARLELAALSQLVTPPEFPHGRLRPERGRA
jgi:DNA-binding PadR family transcriptional regulator